MYVGVLGTYYKVYAIGETEEEVLKNLLKGYKKYHPKGERIIESPKNGRELIEYFGGGIHKVKNGYANE